MSSIQDQIAAAWKKYSESSSVMKNRENFTAGYLAALRSLFVEVKPEDLEEWRTYFVWHVDEWVECGFYRGDRKSPDWFEYQADTGDGKETFMILASEARRILQCNLPSPSDLFTEI